MTSPIELGIGVPISGNSGMGLFQAPCYERPDWGQTKRVVERCELLGYDSIFVADHLLLDSDSAILKRRTNLPGAVSTPQGRRLAHINLSDAIRNSALTAKIVAKLNIVSSGRFYPVF